jgi:hypothetical protein
MSLTARQTLIILIGSTVRAFIGVQNPNAILKYFAAAFDRKFNQSLATASLRRASMARRFCWNTE